MLCIACDHAGYELKEHMKKYLADKGYEVLDLGTDGPDSVDYPLYGQRAGECVARGQAEKGIIICGTGIGISMAANKVPGVRAALCMTTEMAQLTREHNDANMLAMGARIIDTATAEAITDTFLTTEFSGQGRHSGRIALIGEMEHTYHSHLD